MENLKFFVICMAIFLSVILCLSVVIVKIIPKAEECTDIICIGGHKYYYNYRHRTLVVGLDDDGKPVKCELKEDK